MTRWIRNPRNSTSAFSDYDRSREMTIVLAEEAVIGQDLVDPMAMRFLPRVQGLADVLCLLRSGVSQYPLLAGPGDDHDALPVRIRENPSLGPRQGHRSRRRQQMLKSLGVERRRRRSHRSPQSPPVHDLLAPQDIGQRGGRDVLEIFTTAHPRSYLADVSGALRPESIRSF